MHEHMAKSEISLDTGDSASNAVVRRYVFINQRCAECVCLYRPTMTSCLRAKIHYNYYMWPFAKKLYHGWINTMTSSNEISWKLPPRNGLVAPLIRTWRRSGLTEVYCSVFYAHFKNITACVWQSNLCYMYKHTVNDAFRNEQSSWNLYKMF